MFQFLKRANFISANNFRHWNTGDAVKMHLYLQKNQWPANEFVDLFMRANSNAESYLISLSFKLYMEDQFEWVNGKNTDALANLLERIDSPNYKEVDNDNLIDWTKNTLRSVRQMQDE